MPKDHVGAASGVTYQIPELTDVRDVEVSFGVFADSLPPFPPVPAVQVVETITANKVAEPNHIYLYAGTTPITVTLPATGSPNDRIGVSQLGGTGTTGLITLVGIGAGVPVTAGPNTALTAVWDGAKWVGLPFSFSGTRPAESSGGVISNPGDGFRYHMFDTPGTYTFTSHKALLVDAYVAAGGSNGGPAGASPGAAGGGGEIVAVTAKAIGDWTFTAIVVGAAGGASGLGDVPAAAGIVGGTTPPTVIPPGWPVIGGTTIGGPGAAGAGPAPTTVKAKGGGGEFLLLAPYAPATETYDCSTGGPYSYDCSYGARANTYQCGSHAVIGDPCVGGQCPPGWGCVSAPPAWDYRCHTTVPTYCTDYACDSGGSLSGTTCVKTCSGNDYQQRTCTRTAACAGGYVNSGGMCVDARAAGAGPGGGGIVVLRYAYP